jgi:drug/metabolite transporter (DMT)-like permease
MGRGRQDALHGVTRYIFPMPFRFSSPFAPLAQRFDALPIVVQSALWMTLSAFGYAASAAVVHHLAQRLPVFEMAFFRNFFGLIFMLPWLWRSGLAALHTTQPGKHAFRGLLSSVNMWCLFAALAYAPIADVSAITFLLPIVGSIFAVIFLKERTVAMQWVASIVGFAGAMIVIRPGMAGFDPGLLFALGAVFVGSSVAMMIKTLLRHDSADTIAFYLFASHIVFAAVPMAFVWVTPTWEELGWLILMGWLGTIVQRGFNRSMAISDASVALPFNFSRLIWAALFGWLFFAQIPDLWTWIGGSVIFGASLWLTRITSARKKREEKIGRRAE